MGNTGYLTEDLAWIPRLFKLAVLTSLLSVVSGDVTTHPLQLAHIFIKEQEIVNLLRTVYSTESINTYILEYLHLYSFREEEVTPKYAYMLNQTEFEDYTGQVMEELVGNPVHMYSLVWRWTKILPLILRTYHGHLKPDLERLKGSVPAVEEDHLSDVNQALVRIQFSYRLNPLDMAKGLIAGVQTKAKLNIQQVLDIASRSFAGINKIRPDIDREFATAIEWLESAREMTTDKPLLESIDETLKLAAEMHDELWISPRGHRGAYPNEQFFHEKLYQNPKTGRQLRQEEGKFLKNNPEKNKANIYYSLHDYLTLCRGETIRYRFWRKPCVFHHRNVPFFYLAPIRIEVVSYEPAEIYIFHDILTESEIQYMKTQPILKSSKVAGAAEKTDGVLKQPKDKKSNERTQSSGWLFDQDHYKMYKTSKRMSLITGLEIHAPLKDLQKYKASDYVVAEPWQVGVYTPGGHYLPHEDAFNQEYNETGPKGELIGDRIATGMFYLSDVKAGGYTSFPWAGVSVAPKKGSAVFWFNLKESGKRNSGSIHAACPTILGIKWVSNKWIRSYSQMFKYPCSLEDGKKKGKE